MKEKKNIDRLYQEQFKDFEAHPGDRVWEGIAAATQKKKKRRAIPLWIPLGGVAALLLVLFMLGGIFTKETENTPAIVNGSEQEVDELNKGSNVEQMVAGQEDKHSETEQEPTEKQEESKKSHFQTGTENNRVANTETAGNTENTSDSKKPNTSSENSTTIVASTNQTEPKGETQNPKNLGLAENRNTNTKTPQTSVENNTIAENRVQKDSVIKGDGSFGKTESNTEVADNQVDKKEAETNEPVKTSLLDIANAKENQEEAVADADLEKEKNLNRWGITPNVAPVYYNSFGGSGIGPQFEQNAKDGEVNLSYGVQVSYAVSKRLTVRSGLSKVNLSYNTDNVAISTTGQAMAISSIDYKPSAEIIQVQNSAGQRASNDFANAFSEIAKTPASEGALNQRLGYLEVPMELEYAVIDQRFGLQVIGGLSTLFLSDNEIQVREGDFTTTLGESNSLNDVSFSTNVGLGLDYKVTDKVKFNLEPMFKYQLNAYKNTVSDFKPYYLGLYTGVSIQF